MRKTIIVLGLVILIGITLSCKKKETATCDGSTPTYTSEIKTLISNNCMPCHGPGGSDTDYSTFAKLSTILSSGKFEKEVITKKSMPTNKSLSNAELSKIQCWIDNGYKE